MLRVRYTMKAEPATVAAGWRSPLQRKGYAVGRHRARSLMREAELVVRKRRTHRYRKAEGEAHVAQHLLERKFEPGAINRVWAGDVTYVRSKQGWSYLAIVMDLHSRAL